MAAGGLGSFGEYRRKTIIPTGHYLRRALDLAIRYAQDKYEYGYTIEGKGTYEYYLSNEEWSEYLKRMSVQHRAQFNDDDGGELVEKNGPHGLTPPKMASFGSSSRLIYELSHDTPDFNFEKLLPTRVGGTANLDGFRRTGDMDIFVESKCGEIYDSHKKNVVSLVYQEVYEAIGAPLEYVAEEIKDDDRHRNFSLWTYPGHIAVQERGRKPQLA